MRKARQNSKVTGGSTLVIILLLMVIGAGLVGVFFWEKSQTAKEAELSQYDEPFENRLTVTYHGREYVYRDGLQTFLIMGLDKYEAALSDPESYVNNQQSDFLFLMIVDETSQSYSALHINRDTMAEVERLGVAGTRLGAITMQLALAHTYGSGGRDSCRNTVQAVSRFLFDVPIDHYLSMTMDAIPLINDMVGGVVVHIDDDFSATDASLIQGEDIRLQGQQALTFVRARMSMQDDSNLARMVRQRTYINALYEQLSAKLRSNDNFAVQLGVKLSDYIVSDMSTSELSDLVERMKDYSFTTIYSIEGEAILGERYIEFYPDEEKLQELVISLFFDPV